MNGLFTHIYVGETFGNEPFLTNENDFSQYVAELVDQLGPEWEHTLDHKDEGGNASYYEITDFDKTDFDEIESGIIEIHFDVDGRYTPLEYHRFKVLDDIGVQFIS